MSGLADRIMQRESQIGEKMLDSAGRHEALGTSKIVCCNKNRQVPAGKSQGTAREFLHYKSIKSAKLNKVVFKHLSKEKSTGTMPPKKRLES